MISPSHTYAVELTRDVLDSSGSRTGYVETTSVSGVLQTDLRDFYADWDDLMPMISKDIASLLGQKWRIQSVHIERIY